MKILELCPYSAGICGVFTRALEESKRLQDHGFRVRIFSSDFVKGTGERTKLKDKIQGVEIQRFEARKLGGESFMSWDFVKEALDFEPEIVIAHNYRHLHTHKALEVAEILRSRGKKCKIFLVTHAPFVEGNITRTWLQTSIVKFYDFFVGPRILKKFDGILAISKWEIPYLRSLGVPENKIKYIPNGIPDEIFRMPKRKEIDKNKILFLGRISEIKNLEVLIRALELIKDKKIWIEIVGPAEKDYRDKLEKLAKELGIEKRVLFSPAIYDLKNKIRKIDSCSVFVLPSKREGMPQTLIEVMARGNVVIGSNIPAIRDLISDGKNGFLFEFNNPKDLAGKISTALKSNRNIGIEARKSVEKFSWEKVIDRLVKVIKK